MTLTGMLQTKIIGKYFMQGMIGELSKNFHGVDIGPLLKILAVNREVPVFGFSDMKCFRIRK